MERDFESLDQHALIARLLHDVEMPDASLLLLNKTLPAPVVPMASSLPQGKPTWPIVRVDAEHLEDASGPPEDPTGFMLRVPVDRMAVLMPTARTLGKLEPAGVLLDLTPMADVRPFGEASWHPRHREDLAEMRAALGCPVWVDGIGSPADAEVVAEAGLDGIVVRSSVGRHIAGPGASELLPEIIDAVAGMLGVYVGGPVRGGLDIFRYLALGAEAVLPEPGIDPDRLQAELEAVMRLTGCNTLEDIGYEAVFAPLWEEGT